MGGDRFWEPDGVGGLALPAEWAHWQTPTEARWVLSLVRALGSGGLGRLRSLRRARLEVGAVRSGHCGRSGGGRG